MKNNTSLTALGGIISALSVVFMFLSALFPFMSYVVPAFSGLLLIVTVREVELKWSFYIYVAVSFLSFLILSDKEAAIMYAFFFGYYTVFKELLDRNVKSKIIKIILKLLVFNVSVVLGELIIIYVFAIPIEGLERFGEYGILVLMGLANVILFLYDNIVGNLSHIYMRVWHKHIVKIFKF